MSRQLISQRKNTIPAATERLTDVTVKESSVFDSGFRLYIPDPFRISPLQNRQAERGDSVNKLKACFNREYERTLS